MAWIALVLFLAAAAGGLIMAIRIFRGGTPPPLLAVVHGVAAAAGLLLIALLWLDGRANAPIITALAVLAVAALGGFFLLSFQVRDKPHPRAVVVVHAGLALAGVTALLIGLL